MPVIKERHLEQPPEGYGVFGLLNFNRAISPDQSIRILFVIGTGRSGTHFLTKCLIGHKQITDLMDGRENPRVFSLVTEAAVEERCTSRNLQIAAGRYAKLARTASPAWLVDQSHPNIWHAEYWADVFPASRFVGIIRNPYGVVASMLLHKGVRRWVEKWEDYPVPNKFLGIRAENVDEYRRMTIAERCALRWAAHYKRMQQLRGMLGDRLHVVSFETLCQMPHTELSKVAHLAGIEAGFNLPEIDRATLTKYRSMAPADMRAVTSVLRAEGLSEFELETPDAELSSWRHTRESSMSQSPQV